MLQVFCPWHDYDFDLRTGKSGTSLQVGDETWSNSGSIIKARVLNVLVKKKSNIKAKMFLQEDAKYDRQQTDKRMELRWAACTSILT